VPPVPSSSFSFFSLSLLSFSLFPFLSLYPERRPGPVPVFLGERERTDRAWAARIVFPSTPRRFYGPTCARSLAAPAAAAATAVSRPVVGSRIDLLLRAVHFLPRTHPFAFAGGDDADNGAIALSPCVPGVVHCRHDERAFPTDDDERTRMK